MLKYKSPNDVAQNIGELIEYLTDIHQTHFAYRGQIKEYPGPLLPSYYRRFLGGDDERVDFNEAKKVYPIESLRKCGRVFYGEYNYKFMQWLQARFGEVDLKSLTYIDKLYIKTLSSKSARNYKIKKIIQWLQSRFGEIDLESLAYIDKLYIKALSSKSARNYQIKKIVADSENVHWLDAVFATCSDSERADIGKRIHDWKPYIDSYHQRTIRMLGFYKPFGFVIGNVLAQQYGLSSLCLDATKSLDVASFFGCFDSTTDYEEVVKNGIGIIYRFDQAGMEQVQGIQDTNYYSSPGFVDICDLLSSLEKDGLEEKAYLEGFKRDYENMYVLRDDLKKKFRLPEKCVANTRIGFQEACLIIPDELREDVGAPQVDGVRKPKYQYIEDISKRPGVEKYYFKHTPNNSKFISVRRENLWPRNEVLLKTIAAVITAIHPLHEFGDEMIIPRLDLLDGGYSNDYFIESLFSSFDDDPILCLKELRDIHTNNKCSKEQKREQVDAFFNDNISVLNFRCGKCLSDVLFSGEKLKDIEIALLFGTKTILTCHTCGAMYTVTKGANGYEITPLTN